MCEIHDALRRPFALNKVHWRIGATNKRKVQRETNNNNAKATKGIPLAYIDARDVMDRLDVVIGPANWQNRYPMESGKLLICEIGIRAAKFPSNELLIPDADEWIWKANGAGDTDVEAEKGKASDAFKRAAVLWGIGKYLYALPNVWVGLDQYGKFNPPVVPMWATPEGYDEILARRKVPKEPPAEKPQTQTDDWEQARQKWRDGAQDEPGPKEEGTK